MAAQDGGGSVDRLLEELVALERSALDRWINLDPQGYLVNYGKLPDAPERVLARWNSTEVYARVESSSWKIIHSHWSYVQPSQKPPAP